MAGTRDSQRWPHGVWVVPNRFPGGWRCPRHQHDFHELVLVLSGSLETEFPEMTCQAVRGDAVLHPAGRPHAERVIGSTPLTTLYASWQEADASVAGVPLVATDRLGRIEGALRWAEELSVMRAGRGGEALSGLLRAALHEATRVASRPHDAMLRRVCAHIHDRLAATMTLDELAAVAGMSRFHFTRRFRQATGESPMRYLRRARVDAARQLLVSTHLSMEAIAIRVGFSDRFHCSRTFKTLTGHPPSFVRR